MESLSLTYTPSTEAPTANPVIFSHKDEPSAAPTLTTADRKKAKEHAFVEIQSLAGRIFEDPENSKLAAHKLSQWILKEVTGQGIATFQQSVVLGSRLGLVDKRLLHFVDEHGHLLNEGVQASQDQRFEYFGIRTIYDRYLLKHPETRDVLETPQMFFMRVACALSQTPFEALELYGLYSSFEFMSSSPTLFNAGTKHEQLSSCFLPSLKAIRARTDCAT